MSRLNRTYSSPSLEASPPTANSASRIRLAHDKPLSSTRQVWESQKDKFGYFYGSDEEDEEFYVIGDRVFVDGFKPASVAYFGEVEFAPGDWVGVVMDNPLGNHNGKVHGREYFQCAPFHGLFVKAHRVTRMPDSPSNRSTTPLPTIQQRPHSATGSRRAYGVGSPAASSVTTDSSYFYDDDYRQSSRPATIASLGHKMDEIEAKIRRESSQSASSYTPTSPVGILKKSSLSKSFRHEGPRSKSATRQNQPIEPMRVDHSDPKVPVFNFRPRRARLDQFKPSSQTSSAAILSDVSNTKTQAGSIDDLRSEPARIGDRVWVRSERGDVSGVLRFKGETDFATGEWAGVELDQAEGKNDGSVLGYRYFYCPQRHGLFVPATRIRKHDGTPGFKAMRSTIKSPPPPKTANIYDNINNGSSHSGSRPMTPSSYYSSPDKTTPSPAEARHHHLSSARSSISSPTHDPSEIVNYMSQFFDNSYRSESPKFDDDDIEYQLKRSLQRISHHPRRASYSETANSPSVADEAVKAKSRARCIKYTFSSSKYDGNPIARRTVEYD